MMLRFWCFSFSHKKVVTYNTKAAASVALVLMNLMFIYFTVLRAAEKGIAWQLSFVMACFLQLLVEVFLYETLECYWVRDQVI